MKLRGAKRKSMLNFYLSEISIRTLSQIVQNLIGYLQIIIKLINILRIRYVVSFVRRVLPKLFSGVLEVNKLEEYKKTPKNLPIHIFSGDRDPVGDMGKGVKRSI